MSLPLKWRNFKPGSWVFVDPEKAMEYMERRRGTCVCASCAPGTLWICFENLAVRLFGRLSLCEIGGVYMHICRPLFCFWTWTEHFKWFFVFFVLFKQCSWFCCSLCQTGSQSAVWYHYVLVLCFFFLSMCTIYVAPWILYHNRMATYSTIKKTLRFLQWEDMLLNGMECERSVLSN